MRDSPLAIITSSLLAVRSFQFSLRNMLVWVTALCLVLAAGGQGGLIAGYSAASVVIALALLTYVKPWLFLGVFAAIAGLLLLICVPILVAGAGKWWATLGIGSTATVAATFVLLMRNWPARDRVVYGTFLSSLFLSAGLFLFAPALEFPRRPDPSRLCLNHLRQIGLAIVNYEMQYGCYPPAYTVDASGQPLHSWRTLILPFLEQRSLYNQIDLSQPWDAPANLALTKRTLSSYMCPGDPRFGQGNFTSYVAVIGPETMWPDSRCRRASEVTDGVGQTILVIEVARTDIAWAEPRDLTLDELLAAHRRGDVTGFASFHSGGVSGTSFADVHTLYLVPTSIHEENLRALFTVAGDKMVDMDNIYVHPLFQHPPKQEEATSETAPSSPYSPRSSTRPRSMYWPPPDWWQ